jgi:hypothetical protein
VRTVLIVAGAALLCGCANTSPLSFTTTSPTPIEGRFACVTRKLNELNYTVTNASRDAGFITGEHQTSGLATAVLLNRKYHDVITVSIFEDGSGSLRKIRATAAKSEELGATLFGKSSATTEAPSETGIADAKAILSACGTGQIMSSLSGVMLNLETRAAQ